MILKYPGMILKSLKVQLLPNVHTLVQHKLPVQAER